MGAIRLTALEVILSVDTLVSLVSELRESKEAAGGITLIAQDTPLPLVGVTLVWGLAGARGGRSADSVALLEGGLANAFSVVRGVTVRAVKVARIRLGADRSCVIGVVAVVSPGLHLQIVRSAPYVSHRESDRVERIGVVRRMVAAHFTGYEVRDLGCANDRTSPLKNRVGADEVRYPRKAHTGVYRRTQKTRSALRSDVRGQG